MLLLPKYRETRVGYELVAKTRTRRLVDHITKQRTVLYLPDFSVASNWRGASEIVKEFRFSLDNNPSIIRIEKPTNPNFVACIAWKPTSETIVRYKLWEDVGEILYVPLYSGQRFSSNFSIEIWSTQPEEGSGGGILGTEDGFELATEEGESIITEQDTSDIIAIVTSHDGIALFTFSILQVPTDRNCGGSTVEIAPDEECTDITFNFSLYEGSIDDDFIPFDGDYYNVIGDCGLTELIKGVRFVGDVIRLQSTDDTWHDVFIGEIQGEKIFLVDQANAAPGTVGSVVVRHIVELSGYRVALALIQGEHVLTVNQGALAAFDYNVLYLSYGGFHYGCRIGTVQGEKILFPFQTGVIL